MKDYEQLKTNVTEKDTKIAELNEVVVKANGTIEEMKAKIANLQETNTKYEDEKEK